MDYEALCLIIKCNPGSVLSYKEELGYQIHAKAEGIFAIPDDVTMIGGSNRFHIVSNGQIICWVIRE